MDLYNFAISSWINKKNKIEWIKECEKAFQCLESYFIYPSILSFPRVWEKLILYLVASKIVASAALTKNLNHTYMISKVGSQPLVDCSINDLDQILDISIVKVKGVKQWMKTHLY